MNVDGSEERDVTHGSAREFAWSPDGRKLALVRDGEIYVVNADGEGLRRLTRNAGPDVAPAWSPDGRKIAFESRRDRKGEIYVMTVDGRKLRRLTRNPASDSSPAFCAGRSEDCLREHARRQPGGLHHEFGRERAAESDAQPVGRRLGCLVAAVASGQVTVI